MTYPIELMVIMLVIIIVDSFVIAYIERGV